MSVKFFREETCESGSFQVEGDGTVKDTSINSILNDDFEFDSEDEENKEEQKDKFQDNALIPSSQLYLGRLKRRGILISEIRKAYLRDIVLLKHIIHEYLTQDDRETILLQWENSIPSLDLRQHFMIYSPHESSLDVIPCETCGGSVEIVHHDSSEIQELSKALSHLDKNKNELRLMIAKKNLLIENLEIKFESEERKHKEEKRYLYSQMKEFRANDELLKAENAELVERNQELKAENHEFKLLNSNQLQMKEQLAQARIEITRMNAEFRQLEEANENTREQIRFLTEKLQVQTMRADGNAKQIAAYKLETEESKAAAQKYKSTADSLQKKSLRIETLLEEARREVEDLRTAKSNLLLDLESNQTQSAMEIEMLEAACDQLRLELDTCNEALTEVRTALTSTMMERENLESNYESLLSTYKNYKAKTDEELANLRKLPAKISELEKKLHTAELDLEGLRLKDAPPDKEALDKVKSQMRRLTQQSHVAVAPPVFPSHNHSASTSSSTTPSTSTPAESPNKRRTDGRRIGVIVKDGREGKSTPAKIDPVSGTIGLKTPTSARPKQSSPTTPFSPNAISKEGSVDGIEVMPQGLVKGGLDDEDDLLNLVREDSLEGPARKTSVPRKASMRSIQSTRKTSIGNKDMKGQTRTSISQSGTKESTTGSGVKQSSSSSAAATATGSGGGGGGGGGGSSGTGSLSTTVTKNPTTESKTKHQKNKKIKKQKKSKEKMKKKDQEKKNLKSGDGQTASATAAAAGAGGGVENENEEDEDDDDQEEDDDEEDGEDDDDTEDEEGDEEDMVTEMIVPPRVLLKTPSMSQRRMTRLASLEDPVIPSADNVLNKVVETLVSDPELANEAGIDDNLKNGLLRSLSQLSSFSRQGSGDQSIQSSRSNVEIQQEGGGEGEGDDHDEPEDEEVDEIEDEMANDVAKTWGQLTKALNNVLTENLGEEIANKASHVIAPVTIEFCSILSKCTMGMWRMTKVAKKSADLFCKLKLIYDFINPQFGPKPDLVEIESAQEQLKNPIRFQKRTEMWMNDYNFNRDLLSSLCRMDYDETLGKLVDSKASSYFGYDPTMRQIKFEVALNTVLQLKDYNDFMIDDIDICLKRLFVDWAESKLNSTGGLGKFGELKLSVLNEELGKTLSEKEVLEKDNLELVTELETAKKRITDMIPDNKRAKDLSDRNNFLTQTLQGTQIQLNDLEVNYKNLLEMKNQLEAQSIIQSATLESMIKENIEKKKLISGLEYDLKMTTAEKNNTTERLLDMIERERARINDLITASVQTEPLVYEVATQTDFIVPPMSMRHRVSNDIPKTTGASSKIAFFPVVTPSIAPPASLKECYPENQDLSLTFEEMDMFGNSSLLTSSRHDFDGSQISRPNTGQKRLPPQHHHDVGLPSVWSETSLNRPYSASLSLFQMQGTYERPSPQNSLTFGNDFNWEQTSRPKTTESQPPPLRDHRHHSQNHHSLNPSKSRPNSSVRSMSRPSTAQNVEEILSTHQLNQYHKSRKFLSSR